MSMPRAHGAWTLQRSCGGRGRGPHAPKGFNAFAKMPHVGCTPHQPLAQLPRALAYRLYRPHLYTPSFFATCSQTQEYLPISGHAEFCRLARGLALGEDSGAIAEGRVATVQALSGGVGCGRRGNKVLVTCGGGSGSSSCESKSVQEKSTHCICGPPSGQGGQ